MQKSERPKKIYSVDEARDVLFQNQIARQTFIKLMEAEKWPTVRIMKRIFLPAKFVEGKLAQIEALADAARAADGTADSAVSQIYNSLIAMGLTFSE